MSNLAICFFFEFTIIVSLDTAAINKICEYDEVTKKPTNPICISGDPDSSFFYVNAFLIFFYAYQIGVFISRSSLSFMVIDRVWIVTTIQGINFLFFFLNGIFVFCESMAVLSVIMVWVGLQGGTVYVNLLYKISRS